MRNDHEVVQQHGDPRDRKRRDWNGRDLEDSLRRFRKETDHQRLHEKPKENATQWPWTLCFYGADNQWWDSFEIWGRWTEGPIVRLARECTNIVWKTLRETWGTRELFAETGYEIDYRPGGIFMKTDGSPRFIFVYDETNTDPKMKIYSKAPDDYDQENFEQEIENRFLEEEMSGTRGERGKRGRKEKDSHPQWHPTI